MHIVKEQTGEIQLGVVKGKDRKNKDPFKVTPHGLETVQEIKHLKYD